MADQSEDDILRATLDLIISHGSVTAAARASGIPRGTLRHREHRARIRFPGVLPNSATIAGWASSASATAARARFQAVTAAPAPAREQAPEDPVRLRRALDRSSTLERSLREVTDRLISTQDQLDQVMRLKKVTVPSGEWGTAPPKPRGTGKAKGTASKTTLLPVLFSSDFQCGEVIRSAEIDGMNDYNVEIFRERYQMLIERTIDLADHHTGASEFPGIIYVRGGDAISGGIHEELAETDELSAVPAVRFLMQQEREGIRRLKSRFGRVRVYSIPGNHGRNKRDRVSKGYTEHSYETLLAWWLETQFENDPHVEFFTPTSGDAYFDVLGWKWLASHGDRMGSRGGAGFVGPAATIARGHQKLLQNFHMTGRPVHCVLTGHLHTSLKLTTGYANGALAGYSEYARDLRAQPDAAKQWLLFAHQDRMISHAFEVQLSPMPRRTLAA